MTDEQRLKIISARKNGVGYASIAKDVGMTKNAVAAFCRRNGLTGNLSETTNTAEGGLCRECGKPLVQVDGMKPGCSAPMRVRPNGGVITRRI